MRVVMLLLVWSKSMFTQSPASTPNASFLTVVPRKTAVEKFVPGMETNASLRSASLMHSAKICGDRRGFGGMLLAHDDGQRKPPGSMPWLKLVLKNDNMSKLLNVYMLLEVTIARRHDGEGP